jgi:hypothetical protein
MAYTRSSPNAADFAFTGAAAYTRSPPNAADISFVVVVVSPWPVEPLRTGGFGIPSAGFTFPVTGFKSGHFGVLTWAPSPQVVPVSALRVVHFGTPIAPGDRTGQVTPLRTGHIPIPMAVRVAPARRNLVANVYRLRTGGFGIPHI